MAGQMRTKTATGAELKAVTPGDLRALVAKSPKIGARLIESAARQGLLTAQMTFARMLLVGQDVPRDQKAAFGWFRAAADSGDPDALNMLGRCYEHGWGVQADRRRAIETYRAAARRGFAWAQYNLGQILISGEPTPAQRREGLGWHLVAAKAGHAKSMNVVGRFCEEGWDMPKSTGNALGWYRKAAEGGDYWGQFNLGRLLAEDGEIEEAAHWFRKAAECGKDEFVASIAPVLLERPEEEFQAIGRTIRNRRQAKAAEAVRAETEMPRRLPRHRRGAGWLGRMPGLSIS
jgi:TPR repeat protein